MDGFSARAHLFFAVSNWFKSQVGECLRMVMICGRRVAVHAGLLSSRSDGTHLTTWSQTTQTNSRQPRISPARVLLRSLCSNVAPPPPQVHPVAFPVLCQSPFCAAPAREIVASRPGDLCPASSPQLRRHSTWSTPGCTLCGRTGPCCEKPEPPQPAALL